MTDGPCPQRSQFVVASRRIKPQIVDTCPNEATVFIKSAFGEVYAYCGEHARIRTPAMGSMPITREEYLVHKIMES